MVLIFQKTFVWWFYRNFHLKATQLYRMTDGEHFEEIAEDLQNLLNLGIKIKSITSDGDKSSNKMNS